MNEIILFEYFTSQPKISSELNKKIFSEALKLVDCISENFDKNAAFKKIHVIRNYKLSTLNKKKIHYHLTRPTTSIEQILESFKNKFKLILIAPETEKISLKLYLKLKKKFRLLNSSYSCTKIFSSKIKTIKALRRKKILCLDIENIKNIKKERFIIKPEYGAGSENIRIFKNKKNLELNNKNFIQKFVDGKKGSFSMLCCKVIAQVLTCNEQIVSIENNNIKQIGLYIGGLESHRPEIQNLASQICSEFKGLFGLIGVDIIRCNKEWKVIEINSRFTSSYVGIKSSYGENVLHEITNFYVKTVLKKKLKINLKKIDKIYF